MNHHPAPATRQSGFRGPLSARLALLVALFLPWLEEETRTAEAALVAPGDRNSAIDAFVRAIHRDDED